MELIIGGAYQGKREYAKKRFLLEERDIFTCRENGQIDYNSPCIDRLEEFTLWCVRNGAGATELFRAHRDAWKESILICMDIFCGVVPLEAENRQWREETGRLCAYLASEAGSVTRMFCGLAQKLK